MIWTHDPLMSPGEAARAFAREYFGPPAVVDSIETELAVAGCYRGTVRLLGEPRRFELLGRSGLWSVSLA